MFSGLVRHQGSLVCLERKSAKQSTLKLSCPRLSRIARVGDSIAVNGVCLTVIKKSAGQMSFNLLKETLSVTALGLSRAGDTLNLEPALRWGQSLDGHFVLGHVDCVAKVANISKKGKDPVYTLSYPIQFSKLIWPKASVAVNGVSLTVMRCSAREFEVHCVPHTVKNTNIKDWKVGQQVNLEFDILAKVALARPRSSANKIYRQLLKRS